MVRFFLFFLLFSYGTKISHAAVPLMQCQLELSEICDVHDADAAKKCIEKNLPNVSPKCKEEMNTMRSCQAELSKRCISPGEYSEQNVKDFRMCITRVLPKLSTACREIFKHMRL